MKTKIAILFLLLGFYAGAQEISRQVVSAGGGEGAVLNMSMSWTLGEAFIATHEHGGIVLTQGFQQGNYVITRIEYPGNQVGFDVKVYPNPVIDYINIQCSGDNGKAIVSLFDINGRSVKHESFHDGSHMMNFESYPAGTYLLKVTSEDGKNTANFKIVKNL
jgi:hypothetical protein